MKFNNRKLFMVLFALVSTGCSDCDSGDCSCRDDQTPGSSVENPVCGKEACAIGAMRCDGEKIAECIADEMGCGKWGEARACEDEDCACKIPENPGTTPEPPGSCGQDACTIGTTRCEDGKIAKCTADAKGCGNWSNAEPCETEGQYCREETQKCQYACGDDCKPFSIILIPDTQYYTVKSDPLKYTTPESKTPMGLYALQMKWIADHASEYNIKMVSHLGDITNNNTISQWKIADAAHKYLDDANIPYTVSTGNHDYDSLSASEKDADNNLVKRYFDYSSRSTTHFYEYFNDARFKGREWFHGFKDGTPNSYATFEVGDLKFLVLALEFSPRKSTLCWAEDVISNHPEHRVIITTHGIMASSGAKDDKNYVAPESYADVYCSNESNLPWTKYGASGKDVFNELVRRHSNVIMDVSGHINDSEFKIRDGINGNKVVEMLVDYQMEKPCHQEPCDHGCGYATDAGSGWMRRLEFDPMTNKVTAKTFSVVEKGKTEDGKDYFLNAKPVFYCSTLIDKKYTDKNSPDYDRNAGNWYSKDVDSPSHQFSFDLDFTSNLKYQRATGGFDGFNERDVNTDLNGEQTYPGVGVNPKTGAFVVVWQDDAASGDDVPASERKNADVKARLFHAGGCAKSDPFIVHGKVSFDQAKPDVAMDENGNFTVVWEDDSDGNTYYEILMRSFDSDGLPLYPEIHANKTGTNQQLRPAIAMSPDGKTVVVWEDYSQNTKRPQIFARGFDIHGTVLFDEIVVSSTKDGKALHSNTKPDVAVADDGSFVVTWEFREEPTDASIDIAAVDPDIKARAFKADGTARGDAFIVNAETKGHQTSPSVGINGSGTYYIAYSTDTEKTGKAFIHAVGYDKTGKIIQADKVISPSGADAIEPEVCVAKDGTVGFTWHSRAWNEGDVRRRTMRAGELEAESRVNVAKTGMQHSIAAACTPDGKQIISWSDYRVKSDSLVVYDKPYSFYMDDNFDVMVRGYDM